MNQTLHFLLLEDDAHWAKEVSDQLKKSFAGCHVIHINTEFSFHKMSAQLALQPITVAIYDIMVRWASVTEILEEGAMEGIPSEISREVAEEWEGKKRWRSGIRCMRVFNELRTQVKRPNVHNILYSVLLPEDIKEDLLEMNGQAEQVVKGTADLVQMIKAKLSGL